MLKEELHLGFKDFYKGELQRLELSENQLPKKGKMVYWVKTQDVGVRCGFYSWLCYRFPV